MKVKSSAPTRIDLAGSTLDIWPLYLFHTHSQTINLTISLFATCEIETRSDDVIRIESRDTGFKFEGTLGTLPHDSSLRLISELINFFQPSGGLNLTTECGAPVGSGLGGSSALSIAIAKALNELVGHRYSDKELLLITQNIETKVIRVLTGVQDYYSAMYGGLNAIHLKVDGIELEPLNTDLQMLHECMVLCYSGKPHFSGTNNWDITKRYIEGDAVLPEHLGRICDIAVQMRQALIKNDLKKVAQHLDDEWRVRKLLSSGISIPKIEYLVNVASDAGLLGAKVCGAGGGGCTVFIVERGKKAAVESALAAAGGEVLDYRIVTSGVKVIVE
jgi:D-glycero-alpha-D-manno-heptose-7-phosphate kinase